MVDCAVVVQGAVAMDKSPNAPAITTEFRLFISSPNLPELVDAQGRAALSGNDLLFPGVEALPLEHAETRSGNAISRHRRCNLHGKGDLRASRFFFAMM